MSKTALQEIYPGVDFSPIPEDQQQQLGEHMREFFSGQLPKYRCGTTGGSAEEFARWSLEPSRVDQFKESLSFELKLIFGFASFLIACHDDPSLLNELVGDEEDEA